MKKPFTKSIHKDPGVKGYSGYDPSVRFVGLIQEANSVVRALSPALPSLYHGN